MPGGQGCATPSNLRNRDSGLSPLGKMPVWHALPARHEGKKNLGENLKYLGEILKNLGENF